MATIVTRAGKGSALSVVEADANFTNLNTDKIELTDLSVSTAATGETSALSYNNATGVLTFTPVETSDLIGLTDISVSTTTASSGGSLSYSNTTGVITFAPADLSSYGTLSNVVEDTTPQLGGNLDVQTYNINTSTTNGSIGLSPNGTGAVNITTGTGLNIAANAGEARIFTTTANGHIRLAPDGTGLVKVDKDIDLEAKVLKTTTSNGDLKLSANGSGKISIEGGAGIDLKAANTITTSTAATDLILDATGTVSFATGITEAFYVSTTTSGTYAPAATNGSIHYVALDDDMTINGFTSPVAGQSISLVMDNTDEDGPYTLTLGAAFLTPGGSLALTPGGYDVVTLTCIDDETPVYIAVAVNDFQ